MCGGASGTGVRRGRFYPWDSDRQRPPERRPETGTIYDWRNGRLTLFLSLQTPPEGRSRAAPDQPPLLDAFASPSAAAEVLPLGLGGGGLGTSNAAA